MPTTKATTAKSTKKAAAPRKRTAEEVAIAHLTRLKVQNRNKYDQIMGTKCTSCGAKPFAFCKTRTKKIARFHVPRVVASGVATQQVDAPPEITPKPTTFSKTTNLKANRNTAKPRRTTKSSLDRRTGGQPKSKFKPQR